MNITYRQHEFLWRQTFWGMMERRARREVERHGSRGDGEDTQTLKQQVETFAHLRDTKNTAQI